jgi:hypothetical protein
MFAATTSMPRPDLGKADELDAARQIERFRRFISPRKWSRPIYDIRRGLACKLNRFQAAILSPVTKRDLQPLPDTISDQTST